MTSIVTDFKSIRRKLERQEQKAEFEAKEAAERASYAGLYGVMVPLTDGWTCWKIDPITFEWVNYKI